MNIVKCKFDDILKKNVKPNSYIDTLSFCKKKNIKNCPKFYSENKDNIIKHVCDKYKINKKVLLRKHEEYFDYNDRITLYYNVIKFLKSNSNQCFYKNNDVVSINDKLLLQKKIGSKSKYGFAYLITSNNSIYNLAAKIMDQNKYTEIELNFVRKINKSAINNLLPHLPIYFKLYYCDVANKDVWTDYKKHNYISDNDNYYVLINELASGDLKEFNSKIKNHKYLLNTLLQVYLSILSLHNLDIFHNDAHWGNFLYHKIKPGGYFHYIINNTDVYIENLGFYWVIWDFGLSLPNHQDEFIEDYDRVVSAFISKKNRGWNNAINTDIQKILDLKNMLKVFQTETKLFDYLIYNKFFITIKPDIILNKKPYKLNTYSKFL
jgi:hypothetical protein